MAGLVGGRRRGRSRRGSDGTFACVRESGLGSEVGRRVIVSSSEGIPGSGGRDSSERGSVGRSKVEVRELGLHLSLHSSSDSGREESRHGIRASHLLEDGHEEPDLNLGRVLEERVESCSSLGLGEDSEPWSGKKRDRRERRSAREAQKRLRRAAQTNLRADWEEETHTAR